MKRIELYNNGNNFVQTLVDTIKQGDSILKSITGLDQLPDIYLLQHSGLRTTGSLLDIVRYAYQIKTEDDQPVYADGAQVIDTDSFNTEIATKILARYQDSWLSKFKALSVDYDVVLGTNTISNGTSSNKANTNTSTDRTTQITDADSTSSYQGFNSTDYSPQSKVQSGSTSHVTGNSEGNVTSSSGEAKTDATVRVEGGDVDARIRSRLRLRDTKMLAIRMDDMDKFLTLPIYIY